jgi:hypothetical protein
MGLSLVWDLFREVLTRLPRGWEFSQIRLGVVAGMGGQGGSPRVGVVGFNRETM